MTRTRAIAVATSLGLMLGAGITLAAEPHPEIRTAQRSLNDAAMRLEHAAHDFGGHRARALELIHQAQGELEAALRFDRH